MRQVTHAESLSLKKLLLTKGMRHRAVAETMSLHPTQFSGMLNGSRLATETFVEDVRVAVRELAEAAS